MSSRRVQVEKGYEEPFILVPRADVLELMKRVKPTSVCVYLAILTHANRKSGNTAYPSLSTIAKEANVARRTVVTAVQELEEAGVITVTQRKDARKSYTSSLYRINRIAEPSANSAPPLVQELHHPSAKNDTDLVQNLHPNKKSEQEEIEQREPSPEAERKDAPPRKTAPDQKLIAVWSEMCNNGNHPVKYDIARKKARTLVAAGFDEQETRELIEWLRGQSWITGGITLNLMESQADSFRAAKTSAPKLKRLVV